MTREEYERAYAEPLTPFQTALMQLDAALTGKPIEAEQYARERRIAPHVLVFGYHPLYYLSDGGHSRVKFTFETRRLSLTSNSLQTTKEQWSRFPDLVAAVESHVNLWLAAQ